MHKPGIRSSPFSSLGYLRMRACTLIRKDDIRQLNCPHQASLGTMARQDCSYIGARAFTNGDTHLSMGGTYSFYQYKNHKSRLLLDWTLEIRGAYLLWYPLFLPTQTLYKLNQEQNRKHQIPSATLVPIGEWVNKDPTIRTVGYCKGGKRYVSPVHLPFY